MKKAVGEGEGRIRERRERGESWAIRKGRKKKDETEEGRRREEKKRRGGRKE